MIVISIEKIIITCYCQIYKTSKTKITKLDSGLNYFNMIQLTLNTFSLNRDVVMRPQLLQATSRGAA